jgi:hypothetical protein
LMLVKCGFHLVLLRLTDDSCWWDNLTVHVMLLDIVTRLLTVGLNGTPTLILACSSLLALLILQFLR